jgi:hypothetical protein
MENRAEAFASEETPRRRPPELKMTMTLFHLDPTSSKNLPRAPLFSPSFQYLVLTTR